MPHGRCAFDHTRVVVVHAVNIGPNLDFLRTGCRTDERSSVVTAASLEVVHLRMGIAADITLRQVDIGLPGKERLQVGGYIILVRFPVDVRPHELQCGNEQDIHPLFLQIEFHHAGGDELSLRQNHPLLKRTKKFPCR